MKSISVIIPLSYYENSWTHLLQDLILLDENDEIIFVHPESYAFNQFSKLNLKCKIKWVSSNYGRAHQLNQGEKVAKNDYLWFLHADSRLRREAILKLKDELSQNTQCIYFFKLKFFKNDLKLMRINELGVKFRAELLKLPFGDQGFFMSKSIFKKLNGFDTSCAYGEDHLFIWKAHLNKIKIQCIDEVITTSARKYKMQGWLHTTLKHIYLTLKQALPQLRQLLFTKGTI